MPFSNIFCLASRLPLKFGTSVTTNGVDRTGEKKGLSSAIALSIAARRRALGLEIHLHKEHSRLGVG